MAKGIRLGELFGIKIHLDFSWFLIFALITWSLAAEYGYADPSTQPIVLWGLAIATSLLFFASVLIHELAHSLVSRAQGIPVLQITLFIFGGAAQISEQPRRARDEFWMALAGPVTSLALGIWFEALWFITQPGATSGQMLQWLANINLMLGLFNLLPGLPLDGGRILHALVWGLTKNPKRATTIAVVGGVAIGGFLLFLGLFQLFTFDWINGFWFCLIGWFLQSMALREGQASQLNDALSGHTAREALMTDCPIISKQLSLDVFVEKVAVPTGRRCFPVQDQQNWLGLIPLSRVLQTPRTKWAMLHVSDVLVPRAQLTTATPDEGLVRILEKMRQTGQDQIAVQDPAGHFLGLVTRENILTIVRRHVDSNGSG